MALRPGARIGHYEIIGAIGAGGMGEVYRARDTRLGREVAVKVLPEAVATNPERLARLEREARMVAALNHPNIVMLHSIEESNQLRFLTMELVEGETLGSRARRGIPLGEILDLALPLAEALAAAHQRGVVHRDLKPGNVMVTAEGRVKVLDFGLAKQTDSDARLLVDSAAPTLLSSGGEIVGTLPYMAPEQLRGEPVDARTDIFALGVIVYELAAGARPFTGATAADVSSAILRDDPIPIARQRPELEALGRVVEKCLQKSAASRFQSARELVDALRALRTAPTATPAPEDNGIRSVAVLPLDNVSHDPAQEYFADGMTEALISDLARLRNLRVISRTSAMKYKGVHKSLPEIARELNVDAIIEGSALLVGKRVRINVQLVSAGQDQTLWSNRYDRDLENVLDLQSDVAQAVAKEIELRVSPAEARRLARRQEVNPEAHLEYLRGQHVATGSSPQAIELSLRHFQRAIELDPGFAPAWAGMADCHHTRAARGMAPAAQAIAESRAAAKRALELDDSLADAYAVLGAIESRDQNMPEAIRTLKKAIELNPGLALAYYTLGRIYYCIERHAEGQEAMLHALSLDPLSMIIHTAVGDAYYYARQYERSVEYYRRAVALDPRFDGAHTDLARSLEALGQFDEAHREYEEGRHLAGGVAGPSFGLAHLAASRGDVAEARRMLAELTAARSQRVVSAWGIAALHASLGDVDDAFRWLYTAVDESATGLVFLRVHPRLDPIRKDPRYSELIHRLGLDRV